MNNIVNRNFISDSDYINHMIPHHQLAVDMSTILIHQTKSPTYIELCRDIIRKQSYEIWELENMKNYRDDLCNNDKGVNIDIAQINMPNNTSAFLNIQDPINETKYLEHMIPHHQMAIDISRQLLNYTTNSYLITLCNKIIREQENEIFYMNSLLKSGIYTSSLLSN